MSAVVIAGDTSGTITLNAPAVSGTTTLTLPTTSGTILTTANTFGAGTAPAFSANRSGTQSVATGTFTKVQYNSEEFDTNSNYDPTTNFRFTPTVAGYYQVNAAVSWGFNNAFSITVIYKNGAQNKWGALTESSLAGTLSTVSALIYLNGTTDYIEAYTYHGGTGSQNIATPLPETYFQASMTRSA
jgi:hypothetical protein